MNRDDEWHDWSIDLPWDGGQWAGREAFEERSYRSVFEHLTVVRRGVLLEKDDLPLICVVRNEALRLPLFFEHYKRLGVTRFIMIDNNSDDGSLKLLLAEKSADVYFTGVPFLQGLSGLYWANGLAHALCEGRWVLRVDADELLVYHGMEKHGLAGVKRWLEDHGRDRLLAPLCDLYPSSPLRKKRRNIEQVLKDDSWFDGEGYKVENWREGWHLTGGPRQRLFGQGPFKAWLSKNPFFRMTEKTSLVHHHYLWPLDRSRREPAAALLHLKMFGDLAERSERFEREGQHWNKSHAYRTINQKLREAPEIVAIYENSKRYEGPQSLVKAGLMQAIDWSGSGD